MMSSPGRPRCPSPPTGRTVTASANEDSTDQKKNGCCYSLFIEKSGIESAHHLPPAPRRQLTELPPASSHATAMPVAYFRMTLSRTCDVLSLQTIPKPVVTEACPIALSRTETPLP